MKVRDFSQSGNPHTSYCSSSVESLLSGLCTKIYTIKLSSERYWLRCCKLYLKCFFLYIIYSKNLHEDIF